MNLSRKINSPTRSHHLHRGNVDVVSLVEVTHGHVTTVLRAATASPLLMARGPWLAWLSLDFLERLPGAFLRLLPVDIGRFLTARGSSPGAPPRTLRPSGASRRSCAKPLWGDAADHPRPRVLPCSPVEPAGLPRPFGPAKATTTGIPSPADVAAPLSGHQDLRAF